MGRTLSTIEQEAVKPAADGFYLSINVQITTLLFTFTVQKYVSSSLITRMNTFESTGEWILIEERRNQLEYPEKTPDQQSKKQTPTI